MKKLTYVFKLPDRIKKMREKKRYSLDDIQGKIACAYAKGVSDGCNHMLETFRKDTNANK